MRAANRKISADALKKVLDMVTTELEPTDVLGSNEQMIFMDVVLRRYLLHSLFIFEARTARKHWNNSLQLFLDCVPYTVDDYSAEALAPVDALDTEVMSPHKIWTDVENSAQWRHNHFTQTEEDGSGSE